MFVLVLLCITLCPFLFCNYLGEEEKAGTLLSLSYRCIVSILNYKRNTSVTSRGNS